jgi:hypothetical protein
MESAEKQFEKPKEAQVAFVTLEEAQEKIGMAMRALGFQSAERGSLDKAYGELRDLLYLEKCPHAEQTTRMVTVPVKTLEKIERWVSGIQEYRGTTVYNWGKSVNFAKENLKLDQVRATIQEILYRTQSSHAK